MPPASRSADVTRLPRPLIPATLGVRHHSPAGARAVRQTLEAMRPACILLEAPADAVDALLALAEPDTLLPVALLTYSASPPTHRFTYPLSVTSPEWVVLRWAREHGVPVRGIDLPTGILLGMDAEAAAFEHSTHGAPAVATRQDPHEAFARAAGATDFSTWWERHLEHGADPAAQLRVVGAYARGLRELLAPDALASLELRESFMRRRILEVLAGGAAPERCLVVCGALHASFLDHAWEPMSDAQLAALPHREAISSPIPYSQPRLASSDGAGTPAPAYLEALDAALDRQEPDALAPWFLAGLAQELRQEGFQVSAAEVIDALALARALAAMAGSPVITLGDLGDAARTCLTRVDARALRSALLRQAVGTRIGRPGGPQGRDPLSRQLRAELHRLGLARFLEDRTQELRLDLRPAAASRGTDAGAHSQSRLLHRLEAAGLSFGERSRVSPGPWREVWTLRWSPALEAELAACAQLADTLEDAAEAGLERALARARTVQEVAEVLAQALACELPGATARAASRLESVSIGEARLEALVTAATSLADLAARRPDRAPELSATMDALVTCAIARVSGAASIGGSSEESFERLAAGLVGVLRLAAPDGSGAHGRRLDEALLLLATGSGGSARVRGLGLALALGRGLLAGEPLASVLSRWLSRGASPLRTADFFEGLLHHQRLSVLEHDELWRHLDAWVATAPAGALLHMVAPFRRLRAILTPGERRLLQARLQRVWRDGRQVQPVGHPAASEALARALEPLDGLELE